MERGVVLMKKTYKKIGITELKEKSEKRKNNPKLRHTPNDSDITAANENAKLLQKEQYKTF